VRLEAVAVFPPEGSQAYVYVGEPPEGLTVAEPVFPPLQVMFTCDDTIVIAVGWVMVIVCVVEQPPLFVAVTV
jgi:hypothetical protein